MLARLGRAGVLATPEPDSTAPTASAASDPNAAARAIEEQGEGGIRAINDAQRFVLSAGAAQNLDAFAVSCAIAALGDGGFAALDETTRNELIRSAARKARAPSKQSKG